MYTDADVHAQGQNVCARTHQPNNTHISTQQHTHTHTHPDAPAHTSTHTHTHTQTHTHKHTHTTILPNRYTFFLFLPILYIVLEILDLFGNKPYRIQFMSNQNYLKRCLKCLESEWTITGNGPYRLVGMGFSYYLLGEY